MHNSCRHVTFMVQVYCRWDSLDCCCSLSTSTSSMQMLFVTRLLVKSVCYQGAQLITAQLRLALWHLLNGSGPTAACSPLPQEGEAPVWARRSLRSAGQGWLQLKAQPIHLCAVQNLSGIQILITSVRMTSLQFDYCLFVWPRDAVCGLESYS